ncbi:efflux RND transporter periplasmic adaptor subunit [Halomonas salinarum]|uniref:efflux RND transporter periplasmic adaptor subunit n=1 Tax=Halomonas salinarum TaxID=1158993 RepID=UPI001439D0DE|nr:efflux RND transporter periplasmic adaptor subunit [Halomonas salinarum]
MSFSRWSHRCAACLIALWLVQMLLSGTVMAQDASSTVIASRADTRAWSEQLSALGTLKADESVTLSATVTEIVSEVSFEDGQKVAAGDVLIRLEDGEEQAQLRAAEALRDERRNALSRVSQLQARNLAPRANVEDSRAQLRQVEAQIDEIEARLAAHRLRAPFDGEIGFRDISAGSLVTPGMALLTLDKLDVVKLDFQVPESRIALLSRGLPLTAKSSAYPGTRFEGQVASIGTRIEPVSRSVTVRARLPNDERRLRPGMLMEVTLDGASRQALVIPEAALIPEGRRQSLLVIDEAEMIAHQRNVTIGARRAGRVEILDGLRDGDLVVIHGSQATRDGQAVKVLGIVDDSTTVADILQRSRPATGRSTMADDA